MRLIGAPDCLPIVAVSTGEGFAAETLPGAAAAIPDSFAGTALRASRHRPGIDPVACPCPIRRFVDPDARFHFVAPAEVAGIATRYRAANFDIGDVHFPHRGENCACDSLFADFGLASEAFDGMATIIRSANSNCHDLTPQADGTPALRPGTSRRHHDDQTQTDADPTRDDILYRWVRNEYEQGHDWPVGRQ